MLLEYPLTKVLAVLRKSILKKRYKDGILKNERIICDAWILECFFPLTKFGYVIVGTQSICLL